MFVTAVFAAIVLVAFAVEAAAGFGGTVVTVALGSELLPVDAILARFLPVNVALSTYVVVRHRQHVDRRVLLERVLPFMGVGAIGGFLVARAASPTWLKVVFALFVIVLSIVELAAIARRREHGSRPPLPPVAASLALVVAGVLHGLFACGGPLAVWVVSREVGDKSAFRATLSALWLVLNVVLVAAFALDERVSGVTLRDSALLLVPLAMGIAVGERIHARLSPERFRLAVFVLLLAAAVVLLVRSL